MAVPVAPTTRPATAPAIASTRGSFSVVAGESRKTTTSIPPRHVVSDAEFASPADTRIMRDEMMPWFGTNAKYGYIPGYYQAWHSRGAGFVFADGHAKFVVTGGAFDSRLSAPPEAAATILTPTPPPTATTTAPTTASATDIDSNAIFTTRF